MRYKNFINIFDSMQYTIYIINSFITFQAKKCLTNKRGFPQQLYGISQNPDTNEYILVQNYHVWILQRKITKRYISGNEQIDDFIQGIQLMTNDDTVFEWMPYNQFNEIKEISKNNK